MSRVPIRVRVALAFAAVMGTVLIAAGAFLHVQLASDLNESIDTGLRTRAVEVAALAGRGAGGGLGSARQGSLIEQDETLAQVLAPDGRVIDSTVQLGGTPVLDPGQVEQAASEPRFFEVDGLPGLEASARVLAIPAQARSGPVVVVVGASLGDRDEALAELRRLFVIGGPIGLLVGCLAGYWVAGTALRPVEEMRARAREISSHDLGERLPVPPADDELRRLGETLNQMLGRLEEGLERERRFVDDASHELRTPLALHKTELELALRHDAGEPELRAAIASSIEEVDRLIGLSEALLIVARSGDEGGELRLERLDCGELLGTIAERFRARASEASRRLAVDPGEVTELRGDRLGLEQALTGMVDNALRHGAGTVRLWARGAGATVELHVSDEGEGLPPGFAAHAFERFARADAARTRGGFGLGLAIVESIARAHGGRAALAAADGGGADVWIELPSPVDGGG